MPDVDKTREQLQAELDSARQRIEQLETAQELGAAMQSLLDATEDVVLLCNDDGTVVIANQAAARRFDVSSAALLGKNCFELLPPALVESRMRIGEEAVQRGQPVRFQDERGGRFLENTVCPVAKGAGPRARFAIFSRDITERRRAEDALEQSERQLAAAQRLARLGSWVWDISQNRTLWSDELYRIFGAAREQFDPSAYEQFLDCVHPEDRARVADVMEGALQTGDGFETEYRIVRPDGAIATIHARGEVVRDAEGRPERMIGTSHDITERKETERQHRALNRRLQLAQKMESLGVLAGGIAHDFNNILTGVLANADLALVGVSADSPLHPLLTEIVHSARRAAGLTDQMLMYSGKGRFIDEDVDVNALVDCMSSLLETSISKKVALRFELASQRLVVRADPAQLRQMLLSLVSNASEAIGDAEGVIAVKTSRRECARDGVVCASGGLTLTEGSYVTIEIIDSGGGMNPDTRERMFEPFFTTKFPGRGLGLAAVRGIVRGHKGGILVQSEVGQGTTLSVLVPERKDAAASSVSGAEPIDLWRGSGTVLVADDESMVRSVAAEVLRRTGFTVLTASDGVEAVDLFRQHHETLRCVLLDVNMPRMNGPQVLEAMRELNASVPVILTSGYDEETSTESLDRVGPAAFIQKPFAASALKETMRDVLAKRARPDPSSDT